MGETENLKGENYYVSVKDDFKVVFA